MISITTPIIVALLSMGLWAQLPFTAKWVADGADCIKIIVDNPVKGVPHTLGLEELKEIVAENLTSFANF